MVGEFKRRRDFGLDPSASRDAIRKAHHKLVQQQALTPVELWACSDSSGSPTKRSANSDKWCTAVQSVPLTGADCTSHPRYGRCLGAAMIPAELVNLLQAHIRDCNDNACTRAAVARAAQPVEVSPIGAFLRRTRTGLVQSSRTSNASSSTNTRALFEGSAAMRGKVSVSIVRWTCRAPKRAS